MEKKKTIAQILDEALEQEFPEEKVEHIGKDYNETAKQEDVSFQAFLLLPIRKCIKGLLSIPSIGISLRYASFSK